MTFIRGQTTNYSELLTNHWNFPLNGFTAQQRLHLAGNSAEVSRRRQGLIIKAGPRCLAAAAVRLADWSLLLSGWDLVRIGFRCECSLTEEEANGQIQVNNLTLFTAALL